jgi:hypothetical protein
VGEECIADATGGGQHAGDGSGDDRGDPIGEIGEEFLLAREMPVEGARLHLELRGDPPHREIGESDLVEQRERRARHALPIMSNRIVFGTHALTIVNSVQVNGVQVEHPS